MSKERDEFIAALTRALPNVDTFKIIDAAKRMMRHARTYSRVQEMVCNGHPAQSSNLPIETINKLQAKHDAYCEAQEKRMERLITKAATDIGLTVDFQGDPRGYTVKVQLPDGRSNSFGGDGWGVPNS